MPQEWLDMQYRCLKEVRGQIQMEVDASFTYLSMGAYFSQDGVNMPGFAKMFFEAATEERSHALHLIDYLLERGPVKPDQSFTNKLIRTPVRSGPANRSGTSRFSLIHVIVLAHRWSRSTTGTMAWRRCVQPCRPRPR